MTRFYSLLAELARRAADLVNTTRAARRITWRTEARWALKQGWIVKVPTTGGAKQ